MNIGIDQFVAGSTYEFRVAATNSTGTSEFSSTSQYTIPTPPNPNISTCQQLQAIADAPSADYVLTQDIDCTDTVNWNEGEGFSPINSFSGQLDGAGHTVDGLYINMSNSYGVAPFVLLQDGGSIHDITFTTEDITAYGEAAGVAAYIEANTSINNVTVQGTLHSSGGAGGIVAYAETSGGASVTNNTTDVTFTQSNENTYAYNWGGIVGYYYSDGEGLLDLAGNNTTVTMNETENNSSSFGGLIGTIELYSGAGLSITSAQTHGSIGCVSSCGGLIGNYYDEWDGIHARQALTITEVNSTVGINGTTQLGGLIGSLEGNGVDSYIGQAQFQGMISGSGDCIGGLVGRTYSDGHYPLLTIEQSRVSALLGSFDGSSVGGFVGQIGGNTHAVINDSYNDQSYVIAYGAAAGGLVGDNGESVDITNSYASGSVGAQYGYVGGLLGYSTNATITNSFTQTDIELAEGPSGAVVGFEDGEHTLSGVYFDATATAMDVPTCTGIEETTEGCIPVNVTGDDSNYFVNNFLHSPLDTWNSETVWSARRADPPALTWTLPPPADTNITTCQQLQDVSNHLGQDFVLAQDIDCSDSVNWNEGAGFIPIGLNDDSYFGTFDGQGHMISGLYINQPSASSVGLFATLADANVQNLQLSGTVTGQSQVGAVAGSATGATKISSITSSVDVESAGEAGGLVGNFNGSDPEDSYINKSSSTGDVSGVNQVGGLVGNLDTAAVTLSFATGNIHATNQYAGGLIGYASQGSINDDYARGSVVADSGIAGGLLGGIGVSSINRSYASGTVTGPDAVGGLMGTVLSAISPHSFVTDSFSVGRVIPTGESPALDRIHAFIGAVNGANEVTLTNNYYNADEQPDCSAVWDGPTIETEGCAPVSIVDNPTLFFTQLDAPLDNWTFGSQLGPWHLKTNDYPTLTPAFEPLILCEQTSLTTTTIHVACDYTPQGWGVTTWVMQYQKTGDSEWSDVSLVDNSTAQATITGLEPNTNYHVRFRFTNDFGTSEWGSVSATTQPQNIDTDQDGIPDVVETAGPNGGDANSDGIQDSAQTNVASLLDPVTGKYAVLAVPNTCTIVAAGIAAESSNAHQDSQFSYPLGMMNFTIHCATNGCYPCSQITSLVNIHSPCCPAPGDAGPVSDTVAVTQYYYGNYQANTYTARKYNAHTNEYKLIPGASITNQSINGQNAVKVSYQVTDGGDLDEDGVLDGVIIDPIGLAAVDKSLATTGQDILKVATAAVLIISLATVALIIERKSLASRTGRRS